MDKVIEYQKEQCPLESKDIFQDCNPTSADHLSMHLPSACYFTYWLPNAMV
jgi:hypothetical protein